MQRLEYKHKFQAIRGRKDGKIRRVSHIPVDMDTPKSRVPGSPNHVMVFLELSPGHLVRQVVNDSRIETVVQAG